MTFNVDSDYMADSEAKTAPLPFPSSDADLAGIRVTRAQFARMMGVSKQAVGDWVKSGRIVLGADDRFDPRQAVARLLATGDPARLRAKVLAPLTRDIASRDKEIERLHALVEELREQLAGANEAADFEESSALGVLGMLDSLQIRLRAEWSALQALPGLAGVEAIAAWIADARFDGSDQARPILDYLPAPAGIIVEEAPAPASEEEGEAGAPMTTPAPFPLEHDK